MNEVLEKIIHNEDLAIHAIVIYKTMHVRNKQYSIGINQNTRSSGEFEWQKLICEEMPRFFDYEILARPILICYYYLK